MDTPETTRAAGTPAAEGVVERNIGLTFELIQAIADDPALLEEIPHGATVILIPADDPDLAARNIAGGHRRVLAGENVYFRHVRRAPVAAGVGE